MVINLPSYLQDNAGPLKAFRFLVEVNGKAVGAFSQFSGIKMEVQTIRGRSGNDRRGVQEYVPVLTSFAPVTLTKGVFGDNPFLQWLFAAAASKLRGPSGAELRRNINVIAVDDTGTWGVIWTLQDAMPVGYELSPMDGARSEVLTESVSFAIMGMERSITPISFS